ncbi:MAG: hypothetical protein V4665_04090 [Patescibacteria group bacterium]
MPLTTISVPSQLLEKIYAEMKSKAGASQEIIDYLEKFSDQMAIIDYSPDLPFNVIKKVREALAPVAVYFSSFTGKNIILDDNWSLAVFLEGSGHHERITDEQNKGDNSSKISYIGKMTIAKTLNGKIATFGIFHVYKIVTGFRP